MPFSIRAVLALTLAAGGMCGLLYGVPDGYLPYALMVPWAVLPGALISAMVFRVPAPQEQSPTGENAIGPIFTGRIAAPSEVPAPREPTGERASNPARQLFAANQPEFRAPHLLREPAASPIDFPGERA